MYSLAPSICGNSWPHIRPNVSRRAAWVVELKEAQLGDAECFCAAAVKSWFFSTGACLHTNGHRSNHIHIFAPIHLSSPRIHCLHCCLLACLVCSLCMPLAH